MQSKQKIVSFILAVLVGASIGTLLGKVCLLKAETRALERQYHNMKVELNLLQKENAYLLEQHDAILNRLDVWLDVWQTNEFEVTAYTLECGNGDGLTATMTIPQVEHTIAVDPTVVPLGSKIFIPNVGWRAAEDTGGAIKGKRVDLYMGSGLTARNNAMRWGRRQIKVVYQR